MSFSEVTPTISPGDAPSTTDGVAPDVPHHETASARPSPSAEEAFDNTHIKGASGLTSDHVCVDFTTPIETRFRSQRSKTGSLKSPTTYQDVIHLTD